MAVLERAQVSAEAAREYAGQWVAIKDGRVEVGSADANAVLDWVEAQGEPSEYLVTRLPREDAPKFSML